MPKAAKEDKAPRAKSAYQFYCDSIRDAVKAEPGNADLKMTDFAKLFGERWAKLSAKDKAPFEAKAEAERERLGLKSKKKGGDGDGIKRPLSAYMCFCRDTRESVKSDNPDIGAKDILKTLGEMWGKLSDSEKKHWEAQAEKDKKRYEAQKAAKGE